MCQNFEFEVFHNDNYISNKYVELKILKPLSIGKDSVLSLTHGSG